MDSICSACSSIATFQRCDLCPQEKVMKTAYKSDRIVLAKFEVLKKMQDALNQAEKKGMPKRYIERLELSVSAFEQKLLGR